MHATHSKHKIQHQYTLHNQTLTPVKHSKYLGVTLSDDLTWRTHISNVVGDASRTLNFLRRTLRIVSQNTKALAYKALVRPKLEYAPSVWDPHHAKWRNALEAVQSRAARFSTRRWHNTSSVTAMKHDLGWEALADRRQLSRVILFYTIHHNLVLIPIPDYLTLNPRPNRNRHHLCYISNLGKSCFYHIRDLRGIRRHLPLSTAKTISNSLITSRLDYCNSLINNIAKQDLSKLQRVENCLARVVLRAPRFSLSLPLLKQLHWLPVNYRIKFKLSTLTYRALAIHQPPYLASLLHFSNVPRQLRSSTSQQLSIPRTKLNLGKRAFSVAAPIIWNELPTTLTSCESLASFRKNLKTYLFKIAFPP